jgi:hypothetical protein
VELQGLVLFLILSFVPEVEVTSDIGEGKEN